jgi:sulfur carrier protein
VSGSSNSQSKLVAVWINGEIKEVPPDRSVAELLEWLDVASERVAVEVDKSIVRKRDWGQTPVASGSRIEIVEFVGGG